MALPRLKYQCLNCIHAKQDYYSDDDSDWEVAGCYESENIRLSVSCSKHRGYQTGGYVDSLPESAKGCSLSYSSHEIKNVNDTVKFLKKNWHN